MLLTYREVHDDAVGFPRDSSPQAAITGVGLLTPLGNSATETWEALLQRRFIRDHSPVNPTWTSGRPRVVELALQTAREAIAQAAWSDDDLADDATAVVVGTSKGSVQSWVTPLLHIDQTPYAVGGLHPTGLGDIAWTLAQDLRLGCGPRLTLSAACATGLHALIRGALMIRAGEARRVLVVAAESSLHPLFLGSFQRLGVLPGPGIGCRPFDQLRDGFLMSEAAASLCLEAKSFPNPGPSSNTTGGESAVNQAGLFHSRLPPPTHLYIDRFALGGDATHLTGGDQDAALLRHLLQHVLDGRPVDLIHAHGTATQANDARELLAVESTVPISHPKPLLYSHKAALGHSLGAAGLVSVVINYLSHQAGVVPGNVCTQHPMPASKVDIRPDPIRRHLRRSIALAAGFGGAMAAVSLLSGS